MEEEVKDVDNGSWLNRLVEKRNRKLVGGALFLLAGAFGTPPFLLTFFDDLFLNIPLAKFLTTQYELPELTALALTYTLVPAVLFFLAIYIYPEKDGMLLTKIVKMIRRQLRAGIRLAKRKPQYLLVGLIVGYFWFNYYLTVL